MIVYTLTSLVLDTKRFNRPLKAKVSWVFLAASFVAMWIWNILLQNNYGVRGPTFDWSTPGFSTGTASFFFFFR
jgi:hypothetical protein